MVQKSDITKRKEIGMQLFQSKDLFFAGIVCVPALLFSHSLVYRLYFFIFFWLFSWCTGKKNLLIVTIVIFSGTVFFNLLVPYGEVFFRWGGFAITRGALHSGLEKAVTLEGLMMLSKATIRADLTLPGFLGATIGESFRIYEQLMGGQKKIRWSNLFESLDTFLLELSDVSISSQEESVHTNTDMTFYQKGRLLLFLIIVLVWVPFGYFIIA